MMEFLLTNYLIFSITMRKASSVQMYEPILLLFKIFSVHCFHLTCKLQIQELSLFLVTMMLQTMTQYVLIVFSFHALIDHLLFLINYAQISLQFGGLFKKYTYFHWSFKSHDLHLSFKLLIATYLIYMNRLMYNLFPIESPWLVLMPQVLRFSNSISQLKYRSDFNNFIDEILINPCQHPYESFDDYSLNPKNCLELNHRNLM